MTTVVYHPYVSLDLAGQRDVIIVHDVTTGAVRAAGCDGLGAAGVRLQRQLQAHPDLRQAGSDPQEGGRVVAEADSLDQVAEDPAAEPFPQRGRLRRVVRRARAPAAAGQRRGHGAQRHLPRLQ